MADNKKCLFIGSKVLGLHAFENISNISRENVLACVTYDDADDIRSVLNEFRIAAQKRPVPLEVLSKPSQLPEIIKKYQPDFCLVIGWYWIIASSTLSMVPDGFFGIHASLLPKYRGGAPLVWQIINGESEGGVTLFRFDGGMDTGDVYGQKNFKISTDDTIKEILVKAENSMLELMQHNYVDFLKGIFVGKKQDHSKATYCSVRKPEDGCINWNWSAEYLYNFIRAQTMPYPGAFCYRKNGEKVTIVSAQIFEYDYYGIAGRVNQVYHGGVVVTCGRGAIVVQKVQINAGICIDAKDILRFGETLQ